MPPSLGFGDQGIREHIEDEEGDFPTTGASLGGEFPTTADSQEGEFSPEASLDYEVPFEVIPEYKVPPGAILEYEVSVLAVEDGEADKAGFLQL